MRTEASHRGVPTPAPGTAGSESRQATTEALHWLRTLLIVSAYAAVLYFSYKLKVAPLFGYQGLTFRQPDVGWYLLSVLMVYSLALALPRRLLHASDFVLWLLFVMGAAPAILLPQYMKALSVIEASKLGFVLTTSMLMVAAMARMRPRFGEWPRFHVDSALLWAALLLFAFATYGGIAATSGLSIQWTGLFDVYELRSEFQVASTSTLLGYALPWVHNVVNPVFMARGVCTHRRIYFLIGAAGQYLIFASTGKKSVLLSVPLILLVSLMFKKRAHPRGATIMAGITVAALAGLAVDRYLGGYTWTSLFVRRFMIVPGALVAAYVATFQDLPKMAFANVFGGQSPYSIPPSFLVGSLFAGNRDTNANVSLFGDGYLQAGYTGIYLESLVLVVLLWAVDAATRGLPGTVTAIVLSMPTIALASGAVMTVIATHGFAVAIVLCAILPRGNWDGRGALSPSSRGEVPSGRTS